LFNDAFTGHWRRVTDFLKLHYVLSRREDSPFWVDNRDPATLSDELRESLDYWRSHAPGRADFPRREEVFPAESHQFVLYGMGFRPEPAPWLRDERSAVGARDRIAECRRAGEQLVQAMPTNRDLIGRVFRYGLQKV
jgi:tryptophan 7-halogenase